MVRIWTNFFRIVCALLTFSGASAFALNDAAQTFTLDGQLFQAGTTTPLLDSNAKLKIQILDPAKKCILYEEQQSVNTVPSGGYFTVQVGSAFPNAKRTANDSGTAMGAIFQNVAPITGVSVPSQTCTAGTYTPVAGDTRYFRITVTPSATNVADTLSPDMIMDSVPSALVAQSVQGVEKAGILQVQNDASTVLTQSNAANIFSTTNYPALVALLNGSSTQYIPSTPTSAPNFNGQRLTNLANPTSAQDAATMAYADSKLGGKTVDVLGVGAGVGGGDTLLWDATLNKWYAAPGGSVSRVASGNGLTGGPITSSGTLAVDVGTTANKILQLNSLAQIPAVDGSLVTNLNASRIGTRSVASTAPGAGQILGWNTTTTQWEPQTSPAITSLTTDVVATGPGAAVATIQPNAITSAKINNVGNVINRLLITDATTGSTVTYATCAPGQVLTWSASGWGCASVTSFLGTTGVGAGTYGSSAVVPQITVDAQGRVTALTNVNIAFPVSSVAGRTGAVVLNAADIGGLGTAATKDVGTGTGNVLQLNASSQIPAVDGSLLTNVNAVQLQSRNVASTLPTNGQVLGWNNSASRWEPLSTAVGSVTSVGSGNGLTGGPITSSGSLAVDVGTTANKILQLNTLAQIPAVDGSLLSNLNASRLQGRPLAATAPANGQMVGWNSTSAQWEPMSAGVGSVLSVSSGAGLLGGPITSSGTLKVDVGTAANQIVQLNSVAQLPNVDGSLLSNVNAAKLATRTIASTLPTIGQFLGWNNTTSQWEPMPTLSGTVTNVSSGAGLLGGPITSNGTLKVDVGTAANQIVQLTSLALLPAVDGSLLTNLNASRIATRTVAATLPTNGQILTWNTTTTQWEPQTNSVAGGFINGGNTFGANSTLGNKDAFKLGFITNNTTAMTLDSSGNVGIGTTSPSGTLEVQGGTGAASTAGTDIKIFAQAGGSAANGGFLRLSAGNGGTGNQNGGDVYLLPGNGTGTATSGTVWTKQLSVIGNAVQYVPSGAQTTPTATSKNGANNFQIRSSTSQDDNTMLISFLGTNQNGNAQNAYMGAVSVTGNTNYTPALVFGQQTGSNSYAESMRIDYNGMVGIGTTSPGATLDVKGHIANSGTAATVGTCGTSPAISGNDTRGIVTLGTGSPTACTVTFNAAYTSSPHCVITPYGGDAGAIRWWITASTTALVMNFTATPTASQQFEYHCMQ